MASKRIVICADGSWNSPEPADGSPPTNIVHVARAVLPVGPDGRTQSVFYTAGVGSRDILEYYYGGYLGLGIAARVLECYRYLALNYVEGDEVYLFGFSRGAFAVRSLCGLLDFCGLLERTHLDRVQEAWRCYRGEPAKADPAVVDSLRAVSRRPLPIRFLGVWDTVEALGIPIPGLRRFTRDFFGFHSVRLNPNVRAAFQALALDEIRSAFRPLLWKGPVDDGQRVEQVWFPGVHADCGGGYPEKGLSDLTLEWMLSRAGDCGLALDAEYLRAHVRPDPLQPAHYERGGLHRFLPLYRRPLLTTSPDTEWLHPSAVERFENPAINYRPENLAAAIAEGGSARMLPRTRPATA